MKMPVDQLHVDASIVSRLVAEQFPRWRGEPIEEVATDGTVNAVFRIGSDLSARFPLRDGDPDDVAAMLRDEARASRELASCCPVATPVPVGMGRPGHGYPLPWVVQTWIPGEVATADGLAESVIFAEDLAVLIRSFRGVETKGRAFSGQGRGGTLTDHDDWMETCFRESETLLDVARLRRLWAELRKLPDTVPTSCVTET
jgi:aminoglycoside phosphotransferase (APT) family kinase protein